MNRFMVAKIVQRYLSDNQYTRRVRVEADDIAEQHEDGSSWWYVPVSIHRDPERMAMIYDFLSSTEEALSEKEGVEVLLVPRIVPFAKWEDIA